jgi:hypothetical protein
MLNIATRVAADKEVKILIFNQAVLGSNAVVDKIKESRDDIYIIYGTMHEPASESVKRANLLFRVNDLSIGPAMVRQAKKQGAKAFVHYSFPRHMATKHLSRQRDSILETCRNENIHFVDVSATDPRGEAGIPGTHQFILKDVPAKVAEYGEDTAFFGSNCEMQVPLIKAVIENHAIYPQSCCPSPYHGFPKALGIETEEGLPNLNYLISEASRIVAEKNMTDRLSTWPVSASMMFTNAGAEYAIKWISGLVPKTNIDDKILKDCMNAYIKEVVGEGVEVTLDYYSEEDNAFDNFKLILMSYVDF